MMVSPLAMGATANTPLPCTPLRRTWMRRPPVGRGAGGVSFGVVFRVLALRACVISFFGYIEFMGARVPACVRTRIRARSPDCRESAARHGAQRRKNHEQVFDRCGEAVCRPGHR